ncbi:MAG TPA: hypothetical protein DCG34_12605 [Clostridiales bacterium]|nr:hypothetical protein [Clostridiales bacterium]
MKFNITILLFAVLFCSCNVQSSLRKVERKEHFVLYDAIHFRGKPNLESEGLKPVILLYEARLTKRDDAGRVVLDVEKVTNEAKKAAQIPEVIVSTDIEKWYGDRSFSDEELANRFKRLFDLFKKENPKLKIGNYGMAPSSLNIYRYRYNHAGKSGDSLMLASWRKMNERRFAAMPHADILFPCLYIPEPNIESWEKDFKTTVEEIRKHDTEKPIIVYLWPAYYDLPWSEHNRLIVDAELWRSILEIAYKYADGAVLWASPVDKDKNRIYWDDPKVQAVWQVTREFIKEKELL